MKKLILLFILSLISLGTFSQDYEEVNVESTKDKEEKLGPHIHSNRNFPINIGVKGSLIGEQFYLGSKFNWQYAFKENKRHKVGVITDFLFSLNSISDNNLHTYIDKRGDTVTSMVYHDFFVWNITPQYDIYIMLPNVRGLGLRLGVGIGLSIQFPDFSIESSIYKQTKFGFISELTFGLEYRFEFNFGLFAEVSGGYYKYSINIPFIPKYGNFITSASLGILYDFSIFKRD